MDLKDLGLYGCFGGLGCEFERDLKASWVHFWRFEAILGASWEGLGASWGGLGASWGRLGDVLGAKPQTERGEHFLESILGSVLGGSWCILGALGDVLEGIFASLGASWACLNKNIEKLSVFEVSKTFF